MMKNVKLVTHQSGHKRLIVQGGPDDEVVNAIKAEEYDYLELGPGNWSEIDFLKDVGHIRYMGLRSDQMDWEVISSLSGLQALQIGGWFDCSIDFSRLENLRALETYWNDGYDESIHASKSLKCLSIIGYPHRDLSRLPTSGLEYLKLVDAKKLEAIGPDSVVSQLRTLFAEDVPALPGLNGLASCRKLRNLSVLNAKRLEDLSGLESADQLEELALVAMQVPDVSALSGLESLRALTMDVKVESKDMSPVLELPALESVRLKNKQGHKPTPKEIESAVRDRGHEQVGLGGASLSFPALYEFVDFLG